MWRNGTSFNLNDLETLITVACDAKEWTPLTPSNVEGTNGKPPAFRGLPLTHLLF